MATAAACDTSTFLITSLSRPSSLSFFNSTCFDAPQIVPRSPKSPSDSCKSRTTSALVRCSKTSPPLGQQSQSDNDQQFADIPAAREEPRQDSDVVRKAFEKAAAYKKKGGRASQSEKGAVSLAEAERIPEHLPPTARATASPEVPPLAEADTYSSSRFDASRNSDTTAAPSSPEVRFSRDESSQLANLGTWNEESRKEKQESEMVSALSMEGRDTGAAATAQGISTRNLEVEIFTRDGVIKRKVLRPEQAFSKSTDLKRSGVNKLDFLGLDFAEKKPTGKPAGLAAGLEAPPPGTLPEVEIITRDGSKTDEVRKSGVYKPKVSTWGVFERPENISQTYGGGRVIMPGEQLETEEQKKSREARTKQLLDAYRKKIGLDVDPKTKADCGKALKEGNDLSNKGELQKALPFFEKVMQQMPFQSELHGSAALQWSVCIDSMNRFQEARLMYEKIATHPNAVVRKRAKEFLFGFQAMDTLKISASSSTWDATVYQKYFDGLRASGYDSLYKASVEEKDGAKMRDQSFLYLGVLMFPLLLAFYLIVSKNS